MQKIICTLQKFSNISLSFHCIRISELLDYLVLTYFDCFPYILLHTVHIVLFTVRGKGLFVGTIGIQASEWDACFDDGHRHGNHHQRYTWSMKISLERLPSSPRRDIEGKKMAEGELREGSGAWLQALGAFFVYTATWYVDSVSS